MRAGKLIAYFVTTWQCPCTQAALVFGGNAGRQLGQGAGAPLSHTILMSVDAASVRTATRFETSAWQAGQQPMPARSVQSLSDWQADSAATFDTSKPVHAPELQVAPRPGFGIVAQPHIGPWHEQAAECALFAAT